MKTEITSFTPRDLFLVGKLDRVSRSLNPFSSLTHQLSPSWQLVTSLLAFGDTHYLTFVLNGAGRNGEPQRGFIQAMHFVEHSIAHIHALSPGFGVEKNAGETSVIWHRLLSHLSAVAGEYGLNRLFACTLDDSSELEILVSAGFNVYSRSDVYRLTPGTFPQAVASKTVRPECETDGLDVEKLCYSVTPHLVRQAEWLGHVGVWYPRPLAHARGEGFVLVDGEGIAGYGHLTPGPVGHWLTLTVHPRAVQRTGELLEYGLALLNYYPACPVYCAVREYQGGVRGFLQDRNFVPFMTQCCLVKHTAVRIQEKATGLVPGLEIALENRAKAPTTSVSPQP